MMETPMKKKNFLRSILVLTALILTLCLLFSACKGGSGEPSNVESKQEQEQEVFRYEHDPRDNPSAMADIVEDETAIYGFRPSKTGALPHMPTQIGAMPRS